LVGAFKDDAVESLRAVASDNVRFTGWVDEETLRQYYERASVYVQASLHEGFGLSVAEAMLAGCIPVVTRAGALPEVVGDCGVVLESNQPQAIADAVTKALDFPQDARARARQRVLDNFSLEKRRRALESSLARAASPDT
jgi:glycosyltransferase involved in cell wall biosynthesis